MGSAVTRESVVNRMADLVNSFLPEQVEDSYFGNTAAEWAASDATQTTVQKFFQLLHAASPEQQAVWRTIAAAILSGTDTRNEWDSDAPYNVLARKYRNEALFKPWTVLIGRMELDSGRLCEVRQFNCKGETAAQGADELRYTELPEYASFRQWRDGYGENYTYSVIAALDGTSEEHYAYNLFW